MLECHDRERLRGHAALGRADRPEPDAPAHRGGHRALRGAARQELPGDGRAHPRARHRPPGRPQGRDLRHAAAGAGAAAGAAAGHLARLSGHHRRALHRLPDRRPRRHAARRRGPLRREDRPAAALLPAERRAPRPAAAFDPCRLGRARRRAAALRLPPVVQDLGRGVRPVVRAAARAARLGALAAAVEHQRPGGADEGGRASAASVPSAWSSRRCCRSRAISAGSPTPTSTSTPGRATPTPPPARRSGSACRWSRSKAAPSPSASPPACCAPRACPSWCAATSTPIARPSSPWPATRSGAPRCGRACRRERSTNRLFDGAAFAADIEQLYRRMWQRAVAGERPEHLPAIETHGSAA